MSETKIECGDCGFAYTVPKQLSDVPSNDLAAISSLMQVHVLGHVANSLNKIAEALAIMAGKQ